MRTDKRIFITGAASGIGRAAAEAFARAGWFVGAYDIDESALTAWAEDDERRHAARLDVTDIDDWRAALAGFCEAAGGIDVLVNNAGVLVDGAFESLSIEAQRQVIEVNVVGTMNGCHAAYAALARSAGRVINMSSASALFGQPRLAAYATSKFAVRGLTESLHVEWAGTGVQVCDLMPLFVGTPMAERIRAVPSLQRMGIQLTADDVVRVLMRAANTRRVKLHYAVGWRTAALKLMLRASADGLSARVIGRIGR